MKVGELNTKAEITWCPGCLNFAILASFKKAISELVNEGFAPKEKFVIATGIGCHGKIYDYLNLSGFYGIHGRVPPLLIGIKLANPELVAVGFAGDGDAYAEGISHLIHAARLNANITMLIHNNQVFALTTGQPTPTTEENFKSRATPFGNPYPVLNPISLMLESGATFVAREYAMDVENLKNTIKEAIRHKGFSFVEILQPCLVFHDTREFIRRHIYRIKPKSFEEALKIAREWNYSYENAKIATGVFYKAERPTLEEKLKVKAWHKVYRERKISLEALWKKLI